MSRADLEARGEGEGYILVDLDRTLAYYDGWDKQGENIGVPVPAMKERVVRWLHAGRDIRIFTARASRSGVALRVELDKIEGWCMAHFGRVLPVQNWKDFECTAIWDDLAISVDANCGWRRTADLDNDDPLDTEEEWELIGYQEPLEDVDR